MKRTPLRRRSSKESARIRRYNKQRANLLDVSGSPCDARTKDCRGVADQIHHRKGRDGDLVDNPDYLLPVCWACHRYIHGNPSESYEMGWMIRRNA